MSKDTGEKILKTVKIRITRKEANFDRACDEAYNEASYKIEAYDRMYYFMRVVFVQYECTGSPVGVDHCYDFCAKIVEDKT